MLSIAHNLAAMNVQQQLGINSKKQDKLFERLSTGMKVNRAADDAAGLAISEKLRHQIRGLVQGAQNAQDGISWVQIGDTALQEVDDMLHRMTELTVQSLNDTYTDDDRAAMEMEFNELQSQIDHISKHTKFNEQNVFAEHDPTFYQVEGNAVWPHDQERFVYSPENDLVITYRKDPDDPPATVTITVPDGHYTTQELADELEDAIANSPLALDPRLNLEYTENGTFNANLEGGARIESVGGALSSLLYETYQGGSVGALIGTTIFPSDTARLPVYAGRNDTMSFTIEDFSGGETVKNLTIPPGSYTRDELVTLLNSRLSDTSVTATKYGTGIMLASDDCIISKFKGNMFQIDGASYTSVFYDNVYHGEVSLTPGTFTGGAVLPISTYANGRDAEHRFYEITAGNNDQLTFQPNGADTPVTVTIPAGRYQIGQMRDTLNQLFGSSGLPLTATFYQSGSFQGLKITSNLRGATSDVGLSESSSAFDTLFVNRSYNTYGAAAVVTNETTTDRNALFTGGKPFTSTTYSNLPLTITANVSDAFRLNLDGNAYTVTIPAGTYASAEAVRAAVNTGLESADLGAYTGKISAQTFGSGQIRLVAGNDAHVTNMSASQISGNDGYQEIFTRSYVLTETTLSGSNVTIDRTFEDPCTITESEKNIRVESTDGRAAYTITLPTGDSVTHQQIIDAIESTDNPSTYTDNTYSVSRTNGTDRNFTVSGSGQTSVASHSYSATGVTVGSGVEGQVGTVYTTNDPATVTVPLKSSFTPAAGSDELVLTLNGRTETLTFDHIAYTPASCASALQSRINATFGDKFGGAAVTVSGTGIRITSRLVDEFGAERAASDTNISCSTGTSSLLRELNTTRTAGSATTSASALLPASGINVNAGDTFVFTLNGAQRTVNLTPLSNASGSAFVNMLNNCLNAQGIPASATAISNGTGYQMRLITQGTGTGNTISYSSANGGTVSPALYGELKTAGSVRTNAPMQQNITITADDNVFKYTVDGIQKTATLTPGTYTRDSIVAELNNHLEGATASQSGGYLTITSNSKGSSSNANLSYDSAANSAMRPMWGRTEHRVPKLNASFDASNHLLLESEDGTQFRIRSSQSPLVERTRTPQYQSVSQTSGYYSTRHATMDGGDLEISAAHPLEIDEWNDDLKFDWFTNATFQTKAITVSHGTYTSYDALRSELQSKLDTALGSGEVTVSVDAHGVVIRAEQAGYARGFGSAGYGSRTSNPPIFGDFYDKV
ncbi:MAG: hypothetical protein K5891_07480, partial [Lachnospiraceae bacterium]|nr:hypothetical protein [Lachnospiraceae bacterium]